MSGFHVPENQTVCWSVYKQAIANESHLPQDFLDSKWRNISRAFKHGEPIWMIVDELKLIHRYSQIRDPMPSPLKLATRVVRC